MFYPRGEGGGFVAGPWDALGIVQDVSTGRYHAYAWHESPLPGPRDESQSFVRLKSWIHHTEGRDSYERALEEVEKMRSKITIADANVWKQREQVRRREFGAEGFVDIRIVAKWEKPAMTSPSGKRSLEEINARMEALYAARGEHEDPVVEAELDALDKEAAELIRASCEPEMRRIEANFDAAMKKAGRLLAGHFDDEEPLPS